MAGYAMEEGAVLTGLSDLALPGIEPQPWLEERLQLRAAYLLVNMPCRSVMVTTEEYLAG